MPGSCGAARAWIAARSRGCSQLTVKLVALVAVPFGVAVLVTVIAPVPAPAGIVAFSFVDETRVTLVAATPLKLTLEPLSKPTPVIVTTFPAGADLVGVKLVSDSVGVNLEVLVTLLIGVVTVIVAALAPLGTVASICVAESTVKLAVSEPNFTLVAAPSAVPVIVTELPVMPEAGVKRVIFGALEATARVCADIAAAPPPDALLAVSSTRIVKPRSLEGTV